MILDAFKVKAQLLTGVFERVTGCTACDLCKDPGLAVPGEGNITATLMFVGEGPGAEESRTGRPFVGRAGKLLDNMIESIGFKRDQVFIANIVKHRPPGNRKPNPDEMKACIHFLHQQIFIIQPRVIVALGATAVEGLLGPGPGITKRRGKWENLLIADKGQDPKIPVMPTFHPAALLRRKEWKKDAWYDLQEVKKVIESGLSPEKLKASEAYEAKCSSVGW